MDAHSERTIEILRRTFGLLEGHVRRESEEPVASFREPGELAAALNLKLPEGGASLDEVFASLDGVLAATPRTTTTRFFNQLFSGRDAVATAGEVLASAINTSMYTYKAAGPHALIERLLTEHMCRKFGFDEGEGVFAPGGSLANFCAMLMARDRAFPDSRDEGFADGVSPVMYTSRLSHYSIPKNANMMGIGRRRVRMIEVDDRGRMRPDALEAAIRADVEAGATPFMINATSGTTVLGAFDPLEELADLAERYGVWLHVDGCLGASAILSSKHRRLLKGSERADSICWNAHKAMGVPLSCSAILTRERGKLFETFNQTATYLFQSDEAFYNMGTMSIQCGRRNDALKLFAAWMHHGDAGYDRRITHLFDLAQHAADIVRNDPSMTLSKAPESMTVCFEVDGKPSDGLCELLRREGLDVVGFAHVEGRRVIRLACVNANATTADIDAFFDHLRRVAASCEDGDNAVESAAVGGAGRA